MEQPDIDFLVERLHINNFTESEITDILRSIIKQQMLYGGTLAEKIQYILTTKKLAGS